jgi:hypothetical protein
MFRAVTSAPRNAFPGRANGGLESGVVEIAGFREFRVDRVVP